MRPGLIESFALLLPTRTETLLLRACLHEGDGARVAWRAWLEEVRDPLEAFRGARIRALGPLLHRSLVRNELEVERDLRNVLRAAAVREAVRAEALRNVLRQALGLLGEAGLEAVVLRGAALAELAYSDPSLRHCHDLDLLVRAEDRPRAARALGPLTRAGVPIGLHATLFASPYFRPPLAEIWARRRQVELAGIEASVLSPADTLLHVAAHGVSRPFALTWPPDAWHVLSADGHLVWPELVSTACVGRLELPVWLALSYLARELGAAVPADALSALEAAASGAGPAARDLLLSWAWPLRRQGGRAARRELVRFALLPSPAYLSEARGVPGHRVSLEYALRPLRFAARSLRSGRQGVGFPS